MSEPLRVPMQERPLFIGNDDIAPHITRMPKYARRFSMDVAEDALAQMGQQAIPIIAEKLAERIVHHHYADLDRVIGDFLADASVTRPIMREEFRKASKRFYDAHFAAWLKMNYDDGDEA